MKESEKVKRAGESKTCLTFYITFFAILSLLDLPYLIKVNVCNTLSKIKIKDIGIITSAAGFLI
jgi:hypothetical protein